PCPGQGEPFQDRRRSGAPRTPHRHPAARQTRRAGTRSRWAALRHRLPRATAAHSARSPRAGPTRELSRAHHAVRLRVRHIDDTKTTSAPRSSDGDAGALSPRAIFTRPWGPFSGLRSDAILLAWTRAASGRAFG